VTIFSSANISTTSRAARTCKALNRAALKIRPYVEAIEQWKSVSIILNLKRQARRLQSGCGVCLFASGYSRLWELFDYVTAVMLTTLFICLQASGAVNWNNGILLLPVLPLALRVRNMHYSNGIETYLLFLQLLFLVIFSRFAVKWYAILDLDMLDTLFGSLAPSIYKDLIWSGWTLAKSKKEKLFITFIVLMHVAIYSSIIAKVRRRAAFRKILRLTELVHMLVDVSLPPKFQMDNHRCPSRIRWTCIAYSGDIISPLLPDECGNCDRCLRPTYRSGSPHRNQTWRLHDRYLVLSNSAAIYIGWLLAVFLLLSPHQLWVKSHYQRRETNEASRCSSELRGSYW